MWLNIFLRWINDAAVGIEAVGSHLVRHDYCPPSRIAPAGGPDSLSIGAAKPQKVFHAMQNPSCACGSPIAELSGPPASQP